jgi:hypothetical protein
VESPKRSSASRSGSTARASRRVAARAAILTLATLTPALPACSYPTGDTADRSECVPLHLVGSVPLPNSVAVPTDVTFRLTFDDYPDPDQVRSDSILLTSGYFWVPGSYGVDLIGKTAVMRPIHALVPQLGYSLHLRPALSSLAGCPGSSEDIEFITGDGPAGDPPQPPATFDSVQRIFTTRCAGAGCHLEGGDKGGACLAAPAAGLSLCAPEAWGALVAVPSREDNQLLRVESGNSARSYLLRKLLPAAGSGGPITGVYGQREPPGEPLPEDQLRAVARWIDGGALR